MHMPPGFQRRVCGVVLCDCWDLVVVCVPCDMYGGPLPAFLVGLRNNRSPSREGASSHMMDWTTCVCVCVCVCVCFAFVVFVLLTLLPQGVSISPRRNR